ncbi:MAG TPA: LysR family transcriptional regulator [Candidatus Dormibacteraeota bacterium]|jgi:DNA-binding transcriptional LysR family regulator|nr:LysR family transcriptional regulator [Candidatus Dormibacteraeota bacterium]
MPNNWQAVELKHLRALRAVAEKRTFWAAADELHTSLSTISDHVAALEVLVGQRVIERSRGRRTVELTEAGRFLLGHAEAIESRLRVAEADFRAFAEGKAGTLHVGIYQSVANKVLPTVMLSFKEKWPGLSISVTEVGQDDASVAGVERGEVNLAFGIEPPPEGPFQSRRLMRDQYVLIAARDSPLSRKRRPSVEDLRNVPMVGFLPGRTSSIAEDFLLDRGIRPHVVFRSNDNATVQGMVVAGVGVALAPLLAVDESDPKIVVRVMAEPIPPRVLSVVWHRDRYRTPAAVAFVETAASVAANLERAHDAFIRSRAR